MFNKNKNKKNENELSLDSVELHTMGDDLLGVENQDFSKKEDVPMAIGGNIKEDSPFSVSPKEFPIEEVNFEKKDYANIKNEEVNSNRQKDISNVNKREEITEENVTDSNYNQFEETTKKRGFGMYIIIFLFIIILGAGGYYVWMIKDENVITNILPNTDNNSNDKPVVDNNVNLDETIIDNLGDNNFSEKTNLLVVDGENFNKNGLENIFKEKLAEMDSYEGVQLEFILVDNNNTPILFKDFATNFGIIISESISRSLTDDFSVFLYNDKSTIKRADLVINIKEKELLLQSLRNSEKSLVQDYKSLLLSLPINNPSIDSFTNSTYKDAQIRYNNLNTALNLSIDYYVLGDYLVIATNKNSGRAIFDKLSKESDREDDIFNESSGS